VASFFGINGAIFVFLETTGRICAKFFQDLGENTYSLQPASKSTLKCYQNKYFCQFITGTYAFAALNDVH